MSENIEKRKAEILDRLATEELKKELALEKELALAEEKRIKYEADQRAIFAELEKLLPEICDHTWTVMPEFLQRAGACLHDLATEYDQLMAGQRERCIRFRGLRGRFEDDPQLTNLLAQQSLLWKKVDLPPNFQVLLDVAFSNRQFEQILRQTELRFIDFKFRQLANLESILRTS